MPLHPGVPGPAWEPTSTRSDPPPSREVFFSSTCLLGLDRRFCCVGPNWRRIFDFFGPWATYFCCPRPRATNFRLLGPWATYFCWLRPNFRQSATYGLARSPQTPRNVSNVSNVHVRHTAWLRGRRPVSENLGRNSPRVCGFFVKLTRDGAGSWPRGRIDLRGWLGGVSAELC